VVDDSRHTTHHLTVGHSQEQLQVAVFEGRIFVSQQRSLVAIQRGHIGRYVLEQTVRKSDEPVKVTACFHFIDDKVLHCA
jgi:hypothetical protein